MLGEFGLIAHVFIIVLVFTEVYLERSTGLSYVLLAASGAVELVYAASCVFISSIGAVVP